MAISRGTKYKAAGFVSPFFLSPNRRVECTMRQRGLWVPVLRPCMQSGKVDQAYPAAAAAWT